MNLREELLNKGATKQQTESKIVGMIEEILAENADVVDGTVLSYKKSVERDLEKQKEVLWKLGRETEKLQRCLKEMNEKLAETRTDVSKAVSEYKGRVIEDTKMKDALIMYSHMLGITKEVFGEEKMTESVMMQAIEAGSYAIWRGIMGSKSGDDDKNHNSPFRIKRECAERH